MHQSFYGDAPSIYARHPTEPSSISPYMTEQRQNPSLVWSRRTLAGLLVRLLQPHSSHQKLRHFIGSSFSLNTIKWRMTLPAHLSLTNSFRNDPLPVFDSCSSLHRNGANCACRGGLCLDHVRNPLRSLLWLPHHLPATPRVHAWPEWAGLCWPWTGNFSGNSITDNSKQDLLQDHGEERKRESPTRSVSFPFL